VALPLVLPLAAVEELMATLGRTESTVKVFEFELVLTAEPLVCAVAYTVWLPWAKAVGWVSDQLPLAEAVAVPMDVPSTYTVTVELATAVPV
jgi:hypothetical protein